MQVWLCMCEASNEEKKNCSIYKCTIKQTTTKLTHIHTHTYAHTQLCDWQRLLQTSTLKLSENHKRFSVLRVCVFACVYLWNFPQRKTHQKKPHWTHTNTHTRIRLVHHARVFVCTYACICDDANVDSRAASVTATAKLPLFMFHACAACCAAVLWLCLVSWRCVDVVATSRCRHLSFPSISNTSSNSNIATKSVSRAFVLALSLLSLDIAEWEFHIGERVRARKTAAYVFVCVCVRVGVRMFVCVFVRNEQSWEMNRERERWKERKSKHRSIWKQEKLHFAVLFGRR